MVESGVTSCMESCHCGCSQRFVSLPYAFSALEFTTRTLRQAMARWVTRAIGKDPQALAPGLPENSFATAFDRATEATLQHFILPVGSIRKNFKFDCVYEPRDDQVDVIADALLMVISVLNG